MLQFVHFQYDDVSSTLVHKVWAIGLCTDSDISGFYITARPCQSTGQQPFGYLVFTRFGLPFVIRIMSSTVRRSFCNYVAIGMYTYLTCDTHHSCLSMFRAVGSRCRTKYAITRLPQTSNSRASYSAHVQHFVASVLPAKPFFPSSIIRDCITTGLLAASCPSAHT